MAPGVGKTYRMLQEGRAEAESGRDIVIGYLEPHGREETRRSGRGPRDRAAADLTYRGTPLEEMDLPAVLERAPELCLIDELAHTNAPGVEHEKRYEDVRDVLDAGIDVFSTVNVQHLESLNDQVAQLTGAHVRETIPDEVLSEADEVVLIDLTPEALIARLRAGKVYRPERVPAALQQLLQDREPGGAARDRAAPGGRGRRGQAARARATRAACGATKRAVAGASRSRRRRRSPSACSRWRRSTPTPSGSCAARGARPSAWTGSWTCWSCAPRGATPSAEDRRRLEALRRLASMLGARLRVEEGEDVAEVAIDVARAARRHLCADGHAAPAARARPSAAPGAERSLLTRLLDGLPGVDVRIVADPSLRRGGPPIKTPQAGRSRRGGRRRQGSRRPGRESVSRQPA